MPDLSRLTGSPLDDATSTWFLGVLDVIETLDAAAYAERMSTDVELRLPGGIVLHGRREVAETLGAAWRDLRSLIHQELSISGDAEQVVHEALAVTVTTDGRSTSAMSTAWIRRGPAGLITSARVYA